MTLIELFFVNYSKLLEIYNLDTMDKQRTKAFMEKVEGKMLAVASEEVIDREGEILSIDGWDLKNFKNNPQLLWYHNIRERSLPIGRAENIKKTMIDGKKKLVFEPVFEEITEFGRTVKKFFEEGFLNSFSVGFQPLEKEENKYLKQELLEISAVPVPALPSAQIIKRSVELGFNEKIVKAVLGDEKALEEISKDGLKELGTHLDEGEPENITKPYPNEHACRLRNPGDFQDGSMRSMNRDHNGKKYRVIMGRLKEEDTMTEQAYRYNKDTWTPSEAGTHCKDHDGSFEAAKPAKKEELDEVKGAVAFESHEKAPDSREWDSGSAVSRVKKWASNEKDEVDFVKFKKGFAWFNYDIPKEVSSYKFPHHDIQGMTMITVWRGVATAMAILIGADSGVEIPEADRKAVYNHLKKHYEEYDKPVPEFKLVEDQVLKGLDSEIDALNRDYNTKKTNKQLLKVKDEIKEVKADIREIKNKPEDHVLIKALELLEVSIKNYKNKGGEK